MTPVTDGIEPETAGQTRSRAPRRSRKANHTGTIQRRADGRYRVRLQVHGKRYERYAKTRDEAKAVLAVLKSEVAEKPAAYHRRRAAAAGHDGYTVRQYVPILEEQLMGRVARGEIRLRTVEDTVSQLDLYVLPYVGAVKLRDITSEHREHIIDELTADGKSENTRRLAIGAFRRLLKLAHNRGIIDAESVAAIRTPGAARRTEPEALTAKQRHDVITDLTDAAFGGVGYALAALLMAQTGCRLGEALAARWDAMSDTGWLVGASATELADGTMVVNAPKTAKAKRFIPFTPTFAETLRTIRSSSPDATYLAESATGTPLRSSLTKRWLRTFMKRRGLPTGSHTFRRSFASAALAEVDTPDGLVDVSRLLGHRHFSFTVDNYVATDTDRIRGLVASMDRPSLVVAPEPESEDGDEAPAAVS